MAEPVVDRSPEWLSDVVETRNMLVATWCELILNARKQILECESANEETNEMSSHDIRRLEADIAEIRDHEQFGLQRPRRDAPHSKNRLYKIEFVGLESNIRVTNRFCRDIARLFEEAFQEVSEGDSANSRGALNVHDVARTEQHWQEIEEYIKLAKAHTPKDQPAVTPSGIRNGPGSSNSAPEYSVTLATDSRS